MYTPTTQRWSDTSYRIAADVMSLLDHLEREAGHDDASFTAASRELKAFRRGLADALHRAGMRQLQEIPAA